MTDKKTPDKVLTREEREKIAELLPMLPIWVHGRIMDAFVHMSDRLSDQEQAYQLLERMADIVLKEISEALGNPIPYTRQALEARLTQAQRDITTKLITADIGPDASLIYPEFVRRYEEDCNKLLLGIYYRPEQVIASAPSGRLH